MALHLTIQYAGCCAAAAGRTRDAKVLQYSPLLSSCFLRFLRLLVAPATWISCVPAAPQSSIKGRRWCNRVEQGQRDSVCLTGGSVGPTRTSPQVARSFYFPASRGETFFNVWDTLRVATGRGLAIRAKRQQLDLGICSMYFSPPPHHARLIPAINRACVVLIKWLRSLPIWGVHKSLPLVSFDPILGKGIHQQHS